MAMLCPDWQPLQHRVQGYQTLLLLLLLLLPAVQQQHQLQWVSLVAVWAAWVACRAHSWQPSCSSSRLRAFQMLLLLLLLLLLLKVC
jgi:hypothetical protein